MVMETEYSDRLIAESLSYLGVLGEELGEDTALVVFKEMTKCIDPSFADIMVMHMLRGQFTSLIVTLSYPKDYIRNRGQAVSFIKELRNATGYGLKEAKDMYDVVNSGETVSIKLKSVDQGLRFKQSLRLIGL